LPPSFRCPKCGGVSDAAADAQGSVTCPQCGARLRARTIAPSAGMPLSAPSEEPASTPGPARPAPESNPTLEGVLREVRAVRALQEQILALLKARPVSAGVDDEAEPPAGPPVRSRRRKTVLLIDDDPQTRAAAVQALETADVPVRALDSGSAALAAIAESKPDVLAMELEVGGEMAGKDVINMIKATMEWVDIPIILYTRRVANQKEARTVHGADEYVQKGPEGPQALVTRVISVFRRA